LLLRNLNSSAKMSIIKLPATGLRISIDPDTLHFGDTSELLKHPLPWIGQQRAEVAARFGLEMDQKDYNLFVLGEIGSGRSSLLLQLTHAVAVSKAVPPDLCYLHNFDAPELPRALRLPAGQGRLLRQSMVQLAKNIQAKIPQRLNGLDFKTESELMHCWTHLQRRAVSPCSVM
jgi:AAA domain